MTRQPVTTPLHAALQALTDAHDAWAPPPHGQPSGTATAHFLAGLDQLADTGDRDAQRVRDAFRATAAAQPGQQVVDYSRPLADALARCRADAYRTQPDDRTAWCGTCLRNRVVTDTSPESWYDGGREVTGTAVHLMCGHHNTYGATVVGAAPGASYAGPDVAVARSTRPADQREARARQHAIDAGEHRG